MTTSELKRSYALSMVCFAIGRAKQNSHNYRVDQGVDKSEYRRLRKESMQAARFWRDLAAQN